MAFQYEVVDTAGNFIDGAVLPHPKGVTVAEQELWEFVRLGTPDLVGLVLGQGAVPPVETDTMRAYKIRFKVSGAMNQGVLRLECTMQSVQGTCGNVSGGTSKPIA